MMDKKVIMELSERPIANVELLIRKPVAEVFEAFVDPGTITKFWFDRSSGRLESGQTVQWHWDLFDLTIDVNVNAIEENKRIFIEWGVAGDADRTTTVEWTFTARTEDTTYVSIPVEGFTGDADKIVNAALDSTGGFALVLAAAKAWLEHGIPLNVVTDSH